MRAAKAAVMLAFLLALSFAYTDPPMAEVMAHNFAPGFLNGLKGQVPEGVALDPEGGHPAYFNATLIGVFPSVEDRIPADAGTYQILWAWGENYSDYVHVSGPIHGSDTYGNDCTAEDGGAFMLESAEYSFTMKVDNETLIYRNVAPEDIAYFNLTRSPEQMEKYNATERMEVRLEYSARYYYHADRGSCHYEWSIEEGGHTELYYYVENGNVTFFTARPVLGEQWFRDNHFDNLVFSKKRVYASSIYLDGVRVGGAHILNFSIYTGAGGAWFINSSVENNYTNSTLGEFQVVYAPVPMIANNESFRYLYEENFSYSGIGRHNLTLVLTDDFGRNHTYGRELLSRAADSREAAGEGAYYAQGGAGYARPGYEKPEQELTQVIIPTGALAVIFIVVAASTWWGMTAARKL